MQGRTGDAQAALQPALAYYRREQQAGAHDTQFRHDFGYALYVSELARDTADAAQRNTDLDQAAQQIDGASAEAQELANMREVAGWIAAARNR